MLFLTSEFHLPKMSIYQFYDKTIKKHLFFVGFFFFSVLFFIHSPKDIFSLH